MNNLDLPSYEQFLYFDIWKLFPKIETPFSKHTGLRSVAKTIYNLLNIVFVSSHVFFYALIFIPYMIEYIFLEF